MAKNRPSNLPAEPRLTPRMSELANPTAADLDGGLNPGGSNSNADGVHTGSYNLNQELTSGWWRQIYFENLMGQHIGIGQSDPEDKILVQGVQTRFIQASTDIPVGQRDPATGLYNATGQVVPAGAWFWGLDGYPLFQRVAVTSNGQEPRVTGGGADFRAVAI
ncbi:hypothetical protein M0G74_09065 [Microbulbifer sp. CAU 1566]|uniref:hypothetical protein n=1 Tax=Microbulbifer sp. CAU 1566 TaxID=2933269 RepID=UPI0020065CFB|nr:hypothetical protein [Microbulbifer sp. CAU 1566]MCK7597416.1 hypothetical protein [Microbulbifer sp. CAU 1566]